MKAKSMTVAAPLEGGVMADVACPLILCGTFVLDSSLRKESFLLQETCLLLVDTTALLGLLMLTKGNAKEKHKT